MSNEESGSVEAPVAVVESKGIKELTEIMQGLKVLATFAGNVFKDRKVSPADLVYLVDLGTHFPALAAAGKDADEALAEIKDLDQIEVMQIVAEVYGIAKAFSDAKKA